ncbi:MAG TPA: uroporphyrinogen-III synthase [Bauldia sp.]|nr:uroporphyrinogen-III synthase [Bauldia sp.]
MRLLVTRPEPDAGETAARLAAMGHEVMVQPMLRIVFAPPPEDPPEPAALIATSRNGIRALSTWPVAEGWRAKPLFVTGEGTARTAADAGFTDVRPGGADAASLADRLIRDFPKRNGRILYAAARDRTGALAGGLTAAGYDVRTIEAYRAETETELDPAVAAALTAARIDGILFFSRRTAAAFVAALQQAHLGESLRRIACYVLSERVAEALRPLAADIHVAAHPDFDGIAAMLGADGASQLA